MWVKLYCGRSDEKSGETFHAHPTKQPLKKTLHKRINAQQASHLKHAQEERKQ